MPANNKLPHLAIERERKPQIGYQSHIFDKINELAAASPYSSRNLFLDATVQILDDLESFCLNHELRSLFVRDEILLLARLFHTYEIQFYPDPRYKSLISTMLDDAFSFGHYDQDLKIDQSGLVEKLNGLTEFQTYVLLITIVKAWKYPDRVDILLFEVLKPKDCGYLILARSSLSLLNADRMAGHHPDHNKDYTYILGKTYSLDSSSRFISMLESKDRDADLFLEGKYIVFDVENDSVLKM